MSLHCAVEALVVGGGHYPGAVMKVSDSYRHAEQSFVALQSAKGDVQTVLGTI